MTIELSESVIEAIADTVVKKMQEPKTGRWIKGDSYGDQYNYYQSYVCSCCKRECDDVHGWNYCPNCGAKMEVEE